MDSALLVDSTALSRTFEPLARSVVAVELAFLGDALECLAVALDPVLMLVTFQRQQLDHRERTTRTGPAERTGGVTNVLTD
jgi:hypothetical protein